MEFLIKRATADALKEVVTESVNSSSRILINKDVLIPGPLSTEPNRRHALWQVSNYDADTIRVVVDDSVLLKAAELYVGWTDKLNAFLVGAKAFKPMAIFYQAMAAYGDWRAFAGRKVTASKKSRRDHITEITAEIMERGNLSIFSGDGQRLITTVKEFLVRFDKAGRPSVVFYNPVNETETEVLLMFTDELAWINADVGPDCQLAKSSELKDSTDVVTNFDFRYQNDHERSVKRDSKMKEWIQALNNYGFIHTGMDIPTGELHLREALIYFDKEAVPHIALDNGTRNLRLVEIRNPEQPTVAELRLNISDKIVKTITPHLPIELDNADQYVFASRLYRANNMTAEAYAKFAERVQEVKANDDKYNVKHGLSDYEDALDTNNQTVFLLSPHGEWAVRSGTIVYHGEDETTWLVFVNADDSLGLIELFIAEDAVYGPYPTCEVKGFAGIKTEDLVEVVPFGDVMVKEFDYPTREFPKPPTHFEWPESVRRKVRVERIKERLGKDGGVLINGFDGPRDRLVTRGVMLFDNAGQAHLAFVSKDRTQQSMAFIREENEVLNVSTWPDGYMPMTYLSELGSSAMNSAGVEVYGFRFDKTEQSVAPLDFFKQAVLEYDGIEYHSDMGRHVAISRLRSFLVSEVKGKVFVLTGARTFDAQGNYDKSHPAVGSEEVQWRDGIPYFEVSPTRRALQPRDLTDDIIKFCHPIWEFTTGRAWNLHTFQENQGEPILDTPVAAEAPEPATVEAMAEAADLKDWSVMLPPRAIAEPTRADLLRLIEKQKGVYFYTHPEQERGEIVKKGILRTRTDDDGLYVPVFVDGDPRKQANCKVQLVDGVAICMIGAMCVSVLMLDQLTTPAFNESAMVFNFEPGDPGGTNAGDFEMLIEVLQAKGIEITSISPDAARVVRKGLVFRQSTRLCLSLVHQDGGPYGPPLKRVQGVISAGCYTDIDKLAPVSELKNWVRNTGEQVVFMFDFLDINAAPVARVTQGLVHDDLTASPAQRLILDKIEEQGGVWARWQRDQNETLIKQGVLSDNSINTDLVMLLTRKVQDRDGQLGYIVSIDEGRAVVSLFAPTFHEPVPAIEDLLPNMRTNIKAAFSY